MLVAAGLVAALKKESIIGGTSVEDTGDNIFAYARLFRIFPAGDGKWSATCVILGQTPVEMEDENLFSLVQKVIEAYRRFGLLSNKTTAAA